MAGRPRNFAPKFRFRQSRIEWPERAPEYLEYTFTVGPMGDASSTVKWTLTEVPGGTQLDLEHEGLPQGGEAFGLTLALDNGWDEHLMKMRGSLHAG